MYCIRQQFHYKCDEAEMNTVHYMQMKMVQTLSLLIMKMNQIMSMLLVLIWGSLNQKQIRCMIIVFWAKMLSVYVCDGPITSHKNI